MSNKNAFLLRKWLNPKDHADTGSIKISAFKNSDVKPPDYSVTIHLMDCYRKIHLDFDYQTHDQWVERVKKIDRLIIYLAAIRRWIIKHEPKKR